MLNVCALISRGKMRLFGKSFHSYIELDKQQPKITE